MVVAAQSTLPARPPEYLKLSGRAGQFKNGFVRRPHWPRTWSLDPDDQRGLNEAARRCFTERSKPPGKWLFKIYRAFRPVAVE